MAAIGQMASNANHLHHLEVAAAMDLVLKHPASCMQRQVLVISLI
jgi:hypothetical protein